MRKGFGFWWRSCPRVTEASLIPINWFTSPRWSRQNLSLLSPFPSCLMRSHTTGTDIAREAAGATEFSLHLNKNYRHHTGRRREPALSTAPRAGPAASSPTLPDTAPAQVCSGRGCRQRLSSRTPALTGCLRPPRPAPGASVHCSSGPSRRCKAPSGSGENLARSPRALARLRLRPMRRRGLRWTYPGPAPIPSHRPAPSPRPTPPLGSPILRRARRVGRRDRGKRVC